jgi:chemotaxis protein methyltransferase CheR
LEEKNAMSLHPTSEPPLSGGEESSRAGAVPPPRAPAGGELEQLEIELLLEAIYRQYGFDFRAYAPASVARRIRKRLDAEGLPTISALQARVLHEPGCMERMLDDMTVHATSMFRDPLFFKSFREKVVPVLRTHPFIRIWHAGCSTGEEVFSLAILLREEGLDDRARVYATDINEVVLRKAKAGIFPLAKMREYTGNYLRGGGKHAFSEYYTAKYDGALFDPSLVRNVVFSQHNLATDGSFSEFNVILCRNVMIYFNKALQARALGLFYDSLAPFGVLALGRKESLKFSAFEDRFDGLDAYEKIYRKVGE